MTDEATGPGATNAAGFDPDVPPPGWVEPEALAARGDVPPAARSLYEDLGAAEPHTAEHPTVAVPGAPTAPVEPNGANPDNRFSGAKWAAIAAGTAGAVVTAVVVGVGIGRATGDDGGDVVEPEFDPSEQPEFSDPSQPQEAPAPQPDPTAPEVRVNSIPPDDLVLYGEARARQLLGTASPVDDALVESIQRTYAAGGDPFLVAYLDESAAVALVVREFGSVPELRANSLETVRSYPNSYGDEVRALLGSADDLLAQGQEQGTRATPGRFDGRAPAAVPASVRVRNTGGIVL